MLNWHFAIYNKLAIGESNVLRSVFFRLFSIAFVCAACEDSDMRGKFAKSKDGKTYFAVIDDNGGQCGPLTVDGIEWPKPIDEPREISPGRHVIKCGGEIAFTVPEGVIYKFKYWGP